MANQSGSKETGSGEHIAERLVPVWEVLTEAISEWRQVANDEEHPAYLRQRYLNMHGVGQQSIAIVVGQVMQSSGNHWQKHISRLGLIDWRIEQPVWQGIAVHGGRVNNTATSIRLLAEALHQSVLTSPTSS